MVLVLRHGACASWISSSLSALIVVHYPTDLGIPIHHIEASDVLYRSNNKYSQQCLVHSLISLTCMKRSTTGCYAKPIKERGETTDGSDVINVDCSIME